MMKSLGLALVSCALAATAAGAGDEGKNPEKVAKELAKYERTGEMKTCINPTRIRHTKILDDYHLIFEGNNRTSYLVTLKRRCPGLAFEESIAYTVRGGSLCRTDVFQVLGTGVIPRASCGLEQFEVLKELPKEKKEKPE